MTSLQTYNVSPTYSMPYLKQGTAGMVFGSMVLVFKSQGHLQPPAPPQPLVTSSSSLWGTLPGQDLCHMICMYLPHIKVPSQLHPADFTCPRTAHCSSCVRAGFSKKKGEWEESTKSMEKNPVCT